MIIKANNSKVKELLEFKITAFLQASANNLKMR
jgi:hypothetical protein